MELETIHGHLLEILRDFDTICRNNHILYSLDAGTMLGAVRHKGFIPWDDDADVAMTRREFKKFIKACKKDLDKQKYVLEYVGHPSQYSYNFAKLKLLSVPFCEPGSEHVKESHCLFLDIFPMDKPSIFFRFQTRGAAFFEAVRWKKIGRPIHSHHMKFLSFCANIMPLWFINFASNFFMRFANWAPKKNVCKICHYGENKLPHSKKTYTDVIEWDFGGLKLFIAKNYEEYLTNRYGDWRKLPPESKRRPMHGDNI